MKFSGKKIIAAKSGNILPYFKVNLSDSQTLPLMRKISILQQILTLKEATLFCKFLHENSIDRKNKVDHDEASRKSHKTVISDFLKLHHRDFSPQNSLSLKKTIFGFGGHFE